MTDLSATGWRKSSYSGPNGSCVEVAAWRKSSYSGPANGCVEVAGIGHGFGVRDSKDPSGPALSFTAADWTRFVHAVETNRFA